MKGMYQKLENRFQDIKDRFQDSINTINYIFKFADQYCEKTIFANQFCVGITEFITTMMINLILDDQNMVIRNISWKYETKWDVVYPVFSRAMIMNNINDIVENHGKSVNNTTSFERFMDKEFHITKCSLNNWSIDKDYFFGEVYNSCKQYNDSTEFAFSYWVIVIFDFLRRKGEVLSIKEGEENELRVILKKTLMYFNIKILSQGIYKNQTEELAKNGELNQKICNKLKEIETEMEKMRNLDRKEYFNNDFRSIPSVWKSLFESYEVLCEEFHEVVWHVNKELSKEIMERDRLFQEYVYEMVNEAV